MNCSKQSGKAKISKRQVTKQTGRESRGGRVGVECEETPEQPEPNRLVPVWGLNFQWALYRAVNVQETY
jgi:hypothetical protein